MNSNKRLLLVCIIALMHQYNIASECKPITENEKDSMAKQNEIIKFEQQNRVQKKVLENGMTVLVLEDHTIPKVSLQIWYQVGSKDEVTSEKGIAHLIEHMIFKGTDGKQSLHLSESDINNIAHTLSASTNAFTTHDFTGYLFDVPSQQWEQVLPVMADCMKYAAFKDDHLNSEMKAVIQELKMRRDKHALSLFEELLSAVFSDHPYHYPIIGYKQDLWNVHGPDLKRFYDKHYHPNNATLIVVGDVKAAHVFTLAKKYFGDIKQETEYKKQTFYVNKDLATKSVVLYRDVAQPLAVVGFVVPGLTAKKKFVLDVITFLLAEGRSSRLYKRVVDVDQLATSMSCFYWDTLFDYSLFFIAFEPTQLKDVDAINAIIQEEIEDIVEHGVGEKELIRAMKKAQMEYYSTMEDTHQQAFDIGKYYVALGDEQYIFNYMDMSPKELAKEVQETLHEYFRPTLMHSGRVVPLPEKEKELWVQLQKESDEEDTRFLSARPRHTPIEAPSYAKNIKIQAPKKFNFPKPETFCLSNGLKVLYYNNPRTPKINIALRLKAQSYFDPADRQGIYGFMMNMLSEGTENYSAIELADELESRGMSFSAAPGSVAMTMLHDDFAKGLELLTEMLTSATFEEAEIEKVRVQMLADIKSFWDNPSHFAGQLIRDLLYKGHPYSKISIGKKEVVEAITQEDLLDLYKQFITPQGATIAIVGDLSGIDLHAALEQTLGTWKGPVVADMKFPELKKVKSQEMTHPINRDQITLAFANVSVDRKHPDYDKLLLFDQIMGGGVLGSMKSRLFKLREQSGLFYGISGSLISGANEQPGMVLVKTQVSKDRLAEAEKKIKETLSTVANDISEQELAEAKNALINSLALNFETNASIAQAFLMLEKYKFPYDYFDKRAAMLGGITAADMQKAVKKLLDDNQLAVFKIGRV